MAALHLTLPLNFNKHKTLTLPQIHPITHHQTKPHSPASIRRRLFTTAVNAYKVVIEHDGVATELEVEPDETILSKALDAGLDVPHDCKLGVCMTCPAQLISGKVDQSEGMLSDDVVERGYALTCASYPRSDCRIKIILEEELLSLQLATAND
ncbi:Ferulic acid decarboxylase 1 [Castilleja foliolosa]|uniref:Ferredoxin n=1 Tax=Castilleja foliolosa TaxID=1961234 RepID=A0ABD3CYA0_9LAMI